MCNCTQWIGDKVSALHWRTRLVSVPFVVILVTQYFGLKHSFPMFTCMHPFIHAQIVNGMHMNYVLTHAVKWFEERCMTGCWYIQHISSRCAMNNWTPKSDVQGCNFVLWIRKIVILSIFFIEMVLLMSKNGFLCYCPDTQHFKQYVGIYIKAKKLTTLNFQLTMQCPSITSSSVWRLNEAFQVK